MLRFADSGRQQRGEDVGYVPLTRGVVRSAKAQIEDIVEAPC